MKKFLSVVGTRPNFTKLDPKFKQVIVNTGQHYDTGMNQVFFDGLEIPKPKYELGKTELGEMIDALIPILVKEKPDYVIVYGDTRSTLAGALAAHQVNIPIIHVEAGSRSGNTAMIEERNRILIDRISTIHLVAGPTEKINLAQEGITDFVYIVGCPQFSNMGKFFPTKKLRETPYALCTIHRAENISDKARLKKLVENLRVVPYTVLFPVHPHTRKQLDKFKIKVPSNVELIEPCSYEQMIHYMGYAKCVITDSGGVQVESYFLLTPCITLRAETEWKDTVQEHMNFLVDDDEEKLKEAVDFFKKNRVVPHITYGQGRAHSIIKAILNSL